MVPSRFLRIDSYLDGVVAGSSTGVVPDDPSLIMERRLRWRGLVGCAAMDAVVTGMLKYALSFSPPQMTMHRFPRGMVLSVSFREPI